MNITVKAMRAVGAGLVMVLDAEEFVRIVRASTVNIGRLDVPFVEDSEP